MKKYLYLPAALLAILTFTAQTCHATEPTEGPAKQQRIHNNDYAPDEEEQEVQNIEAQNHNDYNLWLNINGLHNPILRLHDF